MYTCSTDKGAYQTKCKAKAIEGQRYCAKCAAELDAYIAEQVRLHPPRAPINTGGMPVYGADYDACMTMVYGTR